MDFSMLVMFWFKIWNAPSPEAVLSKVSCYFCIWIHMTMNSYFIWIHISSNLCNHSCPWLTILSQTQFRKGTWTLVCSSCYDLKFEMHQVQRQCCQGKLLFLHMNSYDIWIHILYEFISFETYAIIPVLDLLYFQHLVRHWRYGFKRHSKKVD
jgi:hypothetical protein